MSQWQPVYQAKSDHLEALELKAQYIEANIKVREEKKLPVHYETHDMHALQAVLREVKEWRSWYRAETGSDR